ncbi:MAG: hypothetical protein ACRDOM_03705, partial [Nocardioides sp.]
MNSKLKPIMGIVAAAGLTVAMGAAPSQAVPADGSPDLSLKPVAGQFVGDDFKSVGNSTAVQAKFTNKAAHTGDFSVLLEKAVPTSEAAYAAALVDGVEGMAVGDLESIGFWVNGPCTGGSPRFNLAYDTDGDGARDGAAFYGCGNHVTSSTGSWTQMTVADASVSDSGPV